MLQTVTVQRAHERRCGEFLVPILLHVQVNELRDRRAVGPHERRAVRRAEQAFQPIAQHAHRVLAGQRRDLRVQRGDLDRDDLGLGPLQSLQVLLQPALGLRFAQHGFPEKVDVHPHALGAALGEVMCEHVLFAGQDDVGRLLLHVLLDQRQRDAGHEATEGLEAFHQGAVDRPEEARNSLNVEDVGEMLDGSCGIAGAKSLVGHQRQRRLVRRRLQHAVELGLLASLRRCLQRAGTLLQAARHEQRFLHRDIMGRSRDRLEAAEQRIERPLLRGELGAGEPAQDVGDIHSGGVAARRVGYRQDLSGPRAGDYRGAAGTAQSPDTETGTVVQMSLWTRQQPSH